MKCKKEIKWTLHWTIKNIFNAIEMKKCMKWNLCRFISQIAEDKLKYCPNCA